MAWPATKKEILKGIKEEHKRLEAFFTGLTDEEMKIRNAPEPWSAKDIMAHVTAWEQLLLGWYRAGLKGIKQQIPDWQAPGVIDKINEEIFQRNRDRSQDDIQKDFRASYEEILKIVEDMPEEAIFTAGRYDWTGKGTLAQAIVVNTSQHYIEHLPALEAIRKRYGK
jgi:hypothetical protein